jgi:DNA topoisomerase IB
MLKLAKTTTRKRRITSRDIVLELIKKCKNESDMSKKIAILYEINSYLLKSEQLQISLPIRSSLQQLLTNDYVNTKLDRIEAQILL